MEPAEIARTPSNSSSGASTSCGDDRLKLTSVVGGETLYFNWKHDGLNADTVTIIFDIIHQCMEKFSNVKMAFKNSVTSMDRVNKENYDDVKEVLDKFNTAAATMSKLWKGATNPEAPSWSQDVVDVPLLTNICSTVFNSAVSSVKSLNSHYTPFSSEVYGETKYEQMQKIIEQLKFKESDVFVDLGSGVGHLVLYVAGGTKVRKAIGIEKATVPAGYAEKMKVEYKRWMGWYKKKYRQFELISGDFLDPQFRDLITKEATIVFINNYAFNPDLEMRIKRELLEEMRDGTRIISTKAYATGTKELNDRLLNDVEAILDVKQLDTVQCPTSWTDKPVPYFLHTVNRAKLETYFSEKAKSNSLSSENSRRTSLSSKSSHSSREGSTMIDPLKQIDEELDEEAYGPTTRHKWKEYVNDLDRKKRKNSPATGSPRWNEADREYVPPGAKKAKKATVVSVKPVKATSVKKIPARAIQLARPRVSEDARAGMEELHSQIVNQRAVVEADESGLVRVNLSVKEEAFSENPIPEIAVPSIPPGAVILMPNNDLDRLLIDCRACILDYMQHMTTEEFKRSLTEQIQKAALTKMELTEKVREKDSQVNTQLSLGVSILHGRLKELGMPDVETPAELLTCSKRIVAQHKELTQNVSSREADVACLEGKTRGSVPFGDLLLEKLPLIDECPDTEKDKYNWFIHLCASEAGCPMPRMDIESESVDTPLVNTTQRKRPRPRNGPGRKGKTEENNEEVDRQVQAIVQAAMRVDHEAKEKERRNRGVSTQDKPSRRPVPVGLANEMLGNTLLRATYPPTSNVANYPSSGVPLPVRTETSDFSTTLASNVSSLPL